MDAIKELIPQDRDEIKIGILIGGNCPLALEPIQVISSKDGGPYAYKTKLGWCVMGPIHDVSSSKLTCNKIAVRNIADQSIATHYFCVPQEAKDQSLTKMLARIYEHDFNENGDSSLINLTSQEDLKFLNIMEKNVVMKDGHYQLPLPFRNPDVEFVNNRSHVLQRANWLKNKLLKNGKMLDDYRDFMNNLLKKGYAIPTPSSQLKSPKGKGWYIPHFGVYHPMKPGKIRVVFDCSATSSGMSLNKELMQGPDLTSKLIGVLNRFRLEDVGIMADIEAMFYQVQIPEEHRTFLRFLWWPDGNLHNDLVEYQMTVHLFGAASSPSCSNFALRKTAEDNVDMGNDISTTLLRNFYVDDMLKSCEDPKQAIDLLQDVKKMCRRGGFNLTKIISSSRKLLESIDKKDHGKALRNLDLNSAVLLPVERALGVQWCVENDSFGFRIQLQDRPLTKRGILSTVSSVYDPLGFAAPFLLTGRLLLQQLSADKKGWDEEPTSEQRATWEKWRSELPGLESIQIRRCFKPKNFGNVVNVSVHHFSDASDKGYGEANYLRLENEKGMVNCCLLMGKSRVAPLKTVTIPRLELTAATVSIKVGLLLARELDFQDVETFYWTDSKVVLGYLKNERRRFHLFVTNRVTMILDNSTKKQWRYVESRNNPADDASRGITINQYLKNEKWFNGPSFLQQPLDKILSTKVGKFDVHDEDPEVKRTVKVVNIITSEDFLSTLTSRTSKWSKLKRIVATILSWRTLKRGQVDVDGLVKAEKVILKLVQFKSYGKEVSTLTKEKKTMGLEKTSSLYTLNPYLDGDGIMRVGGRLSRSHIQDLNTIHPIILPSKSNVTLMIARECHEKVQHSGRGFTINEIRRRGYWIVRCNSFVRGLISKCVSCRWLRGKTATQKMANLPTDRIDEQPPFTVCGVDFFGPFFIKDGRKEVKRYGAMFTCFLTRAVHIESSNTLDTDSFIQALRRFIARRGNVRTLRCDNGTNFVGAETELHKALKEMDDKKVSSFLQLHGGDWINWRRNPPSSSHFGGVWERQIRTARSILSALLRTHGNSLNDESFRTLLVEVEGIVNSRPLTVETLSDVNSAIPLSPSNLLTMKSTVIIPPPGNITVQLIFKSKYEVFKRK